MLSPEIETERLLLRRYRESDVDAIYEIITDERLSKYIKFPKKTKAEELDCIKQWIKEADNSNYEKWVIERKSDGVVVGNIDVSNASKETKNLDLLVAESIPALVTTSDNLESFTPSLTLNEEILAPIQEGDVLGKVTYSINGVDYTTDVIASHTVEESKVLSYVLYTGIILIFLFLVYEAFFKRKKKRR